MKKKARVNRAKKLVSANHSIFRSISLSDREKCVKRYDVQHESNGHHTYSPTYPSLNTVRWNQSISWRDHSHL